LALFWNGILRIVSVLRNEMIKNIIGLAGAMISLLIILEISFSFVMISAGGEKTLVGKNWFNYYWKENKLGYRDNDPTEIDRPDKKNILVIGDSYVAGHGLKKESERFSNVIRNELRDCADVFNLGICGADTKDEFSFLTNFPVKPDLIILSYVNNDIYNILDKNEILKILKINPINKTYLNRYSSKSEFIKSNSFVINSIDYMLFEQKKNQEFNALISNYSSLDELFKSEEGRSLELSYYNNDSLMKIQLNNIEKFIQYANENNFKILFILFPILNDQIIDYSNRIANEPIAEYIINRGGHVINLTKCLKNISEDRRHVNKYDSHPGVYTNSVIADTIINKLVQLKLYNK